MKKKVRRVLFDLDGTLFDTQIFHARAEVALMAQHDVTISAEEISAKYAGRPTEQVFKEVLSCDDALARELMKKKWEVIFPTAPEAQPLCDIKSLLQGLRSRQIAYSIGTASPVKWAYDLLTVNGLISEFDHIAIVGGDMVERGKPDPDIWVRAACGTPLDECFVVEDGMAGIQAAHTVGIPCALLLPKKYPGTYEIRCASDVLNFI